MKILPFTLLVPDKNSVVTKHIDLPDFHPYLHRHDECQITLVQESEGTLIAGNSMHNFQAGDVFLIGANVPHLFKINPKYFVSDNGVLIRAVSIYFNPEGLIGSLFSLPEMKNSKSFLQQNKHGFKIAAKDTNQLSAKLLSLHNSSGTDLICKFIELLNDFKEMKGVAQLCPTVYSSDISESEGVRLSKILNFIMQNYNNQITLEDVSEVAYMTPQAFCRYFKKHIGRNFISFLNEVRIHEACKSLIADKKEDCISGIAYNSGFNSITNFNRVFKSLMGSSPKGYISSYNKLNNVSYMNM